MRSIPFLLLLTAAAGCGKEAPSKAPTKTAPARTEATLVTPSRRDVRHTLSRPGHIEAFEQTAIYVKLSAYVQEVKVDIGVPVKTGDLLAELRIPELQVELVQKTALVKQSAATLASAQAKVKAAEAAILRARADVKRWEVEQKRQQRMVRTGTLDRQSLDATEAQLEAARAAVAQARAEVVKAQADVAVARQNVAVAQANQDYVSALLQYTRLEAPYPAVVVRRNVNTGDFVQPAAGTRGEALFVVARTDKGMRVFVDVPELDTPFITEQTQAVIRVRALPGLAVKGQVRRSAYALDPRTRTLRTEVDVRQPGKLRPGMYAYITLVTEHKNVWTLPASAVVIKDNEAYCFRVEKGKAVKMPLQTGLGDSKWIEVLKKQVQPARTGVEGRWEDVTGTEQLIQNAEKLTDGQEVKRSAGK